MTTSHHQHPDDVDIAQNSLRDVLIAIDLKKTSSFTKPVFLYKLEEGILRCIIRDAGDKTIPNIVLPKMSNPKIVEFLDSVPKFTKKKGKDPDGRVEGHAYVLVSEVVGQSPKNVYYALLKKC